MAGKDYKMDLYKNMKGRIPIERQRITIPLSGEESISAVLTLPRNETRSLGVITAHGAGNNMEQALLVAFSDRLAEAGYPALRFNFLYKEKGLKAPDRPEKLEKAWMAACRYFLEDSGAGLTGIIAAGKSMGGRMASQMVADKKLPAQGLIFLGYPLHPAGNLSKLRDAHLYQIGIPMLFFAGTRDTLCDLATLQGVLDKMSAPWDLEIIEGGDHSFRIPKSMGIPESDIHARLAEKTVRWLEKTFQPSRRVKSYQIFR